MIVRECVRRYARLPQIFVLDGGKEFESGYFEALLARFEITKKSRPPAKACFGSTCERIFGTANKQFFHCLQGNTQLARNARQSTKSVDPRNHALWALKELHRALSEHAYEIYDTMHHPALSDRVRVRRSTPRLPTRFLSMGEPRCSAAVPGHVDSALLIAAQGVHGIELGGPARGDISGHRCDKREERRQQGEDERFDSNDAEHGAGNGVGQKQ